MATDPDPSTSASVLGKVKNRQDQIAWRAFDTTYRPLIFSRCMCEGLNESDAEEVTQRILVKLVEKLQVFEYDPQKGRFRDWLQRVACNEVLDFVKHRPPDMGSGDTSVRELLNNIPSPDDDSAKAMEEFEALLTQATGRVRIQAGELRWMIFEGICNGRPAKEIHSETGIPVARIYKYCSEIRKLIRQDLEKLLDRDFSTRQTK